MRLVRVIFAACACLPLISCSTVPPLELASGSFETDIFVRDVVRRVKCEISNSFDDMVEDPRFYWLQNWTAKVDLTLQINTQVGLTPTVATTKFFKNAFNFDAGSTSLTSKVIQAVQQTFSVNAGATLNEQAQRLETVTFSLSLKEIKVWRERLRQEATYTQQDPFCDPGWRGLTGHLGLKEWVQSALYPVAVSELQAGEHPSPAGGASRPPPSGGSGVKAKAAVYKDVASARSEVTLAAKNAADSAAAATASLKNSSAAAASVQSAMQNVIGPFLPVLTDELKVTLGRHSSIINTAEKYAEGDADKAENAAADAEAQKQKIFSSEPTPEGTINAAPVLEAQTDEAEARKFADDAKKQEATAAHSANQILGWSPNPPIDGLLHSVQFIVTVGASVAPTWSLLEWKGPSVTGPMAAASGVRTNTLNIALGAPSEQNRLIQNVTVTNASRLQ